MLHFIFELAGSPTRIPQSQQRLFGPAAICNQLKAFNRYVKRMEFSELLEQLDIEVDAPVPKLPLHAGGPVETGRGFVLHSGDYGEATTLRVSDKVGLTATVECLKLIADGSGPKQSLLALGYAGWAAGQLENEMQQNAWLSGDADSKIIFDTPIEDKWPNAMAMIGVDVSKLSAESGHA